MMSTLSLILTYALRILRREWRKFVLPFLTLTITTVVLSLTLFLTESGNTLIAEKSRELTGGDVQIETDTPFDPRTLLDALDINDATVSLTRELTITVQKGEQTTPLSLTVVDDTYPLYGVVTLGSSPYTKPDAGTILLDQNALDRLNARVGDTITVGERSFVIEDVLVSEPTSLFGSFRFLPVGIVGSEGFDALGLDPNLLRMEYEYNYKIPTIESDMEERILAYEDTNNLRLRLATNAEERRLANFGTVTDFLVLAVLITAVLATVNVYASTLHFIRMERKSFAVLLALGLPRPHILGVVGGALLFVAVIAFVFGSLSSLFAFDALRLYGESTFDILLPIPQYTYPLLITMVLLASTLIASFIPSVRSLFSLSPRAILIGKNEEVGTGTTKTLTLVTLMTLVPLFILASVLLESAEGGLLALLLVLGIYLGVALLFFLLIRVLYAHRARFPFLLRNIVSHKKADGIFGIVSFTSLFVALTSLCVLSLTHVALERYLVNDLGTSLPTTYIIDVQPSQQDALTKSFPNLTLFPNIGARIIDIDGLRVQDALEAGDPSIDRELGREYNLTYRTALLTSESIVAGETTIGDTGDISVDREFAERANIELGSRISFLIQGFEVNGVVTSLRETDSRSGLPFFYFVLSPDDIGMFPGVSFGYAFFDDTEQRALGSFIAQEMPNVSMIETESLRPQLLSLMNTLLTLVFVIAFPPLLVALLLIVTLVISNYGTRRREGARMRALGATRAYVMTEYLTETISLTLVSGVVAYIIGVLTTGGLTSYYLKIDSLALFDPELVLGLLLIVGVVGIIGVYLYVTDKTPLRDVLSQD